MHAGETSSVRPTLAPSDVLHTEIADFMPKAVLHPVMRFLEIMNRTQMLDSLEYQNTWVYAPEIKYCASMRSIKVTDRIYAAGDALGFSRGIYPAAASGTIAANEIRKRITHRGTTRDYA